jgi:energy-converting hydrogenase A subunit M
MSNALPIPNISHEINIRLDAQNQVWTNQMGITSALEALPSIEEARRQAVLGRIVHYVLQLLHF